MATSLFHAVGVLRRPKTMLLKSVLKEGAKEILTIKERKGKIIIKRKMYIQSRKALVRNKGTIDAESNLVGNMG